MRVFEYVVTWEKGDEDSADYQFKLIRDRATILAKDDKSAIMRITRSIPDSEIDGDIDGLKIHLRPF
jgi:hypothetical protein